MLDWLASREDNPEMLVRRARLRIAVERVVAEGRSLTHDPSGSAGTGASADAVTAALGATG